MLLIKQNANIAKRRQLGIRVGIEPRNAFKTIGQMLLEKQNAKQK